jgi:7,8-dihydro-6-hydroxymethylpterin-pyrophosphokinase
VNSPNLTIPHPRLAERAFVLVPLDELVPDLVPPSENAISVHQMLQAVDTKGIQMYREHHGS